MFVCVESEREGWGVVERENLSTHETHAKFKSGEIYVYTTRK